jgi:predicted DNA-binding antitoxin AbrB/MazE fold protein
MSRNLHAIYENGVFKPLEPVNMEEHKRVTLRVDEHNEHEQMEELSCYELAARFGLFEAASDEVPPDLSTNKIYFAGFGRG